MRVIGIDERHMVRERDGAHFVVFIYEGDGSRHTSWAVDSLLLTDATFPDVLRWLAENLPTNCCWCLGLVRDPERPSEGSDLDVSWVVGSDVLNTDPSDRSPYAQRMAEEMLARRHRVTLA